MATYAKLSRRFQITIPKELRSRLNLKPGQKLHVWELHGTIRVSVPRPLSELRGMAKGIKWDPEKDRDRNDRF